MRIERAMSHPEVIEGLRAAMERTGQEPFVMPSGGGHDAAAFSTAAISSTMVFVLNRNGSHDPHEAMELPDFADATDIVYEFLARRQ